MRADGVAVVTYDVPGEPVNTLKASFSRGVRRAARRVERDPRDQGGGPHLGQARQFIAGADIEMLKAAKTRARGRGALPRGARGTIGTLGDSQKPVVAAVHGAGARRRLRGGARLPTRRVLTRRQEDGARLPRGAARPSSRAQRAAAARRQGRRSRSRSTTASPARTCAPAKARQLGVADDVVAAADPRATSPPSSRMKLARGRAQPNAQAAARQEGRRWHGALTALALEENPVGRAILFKQARERAREEDARPLPGARAHHRRAQDLRSTTGFEASQGGRGQSRSASSW